MMKAGEALEIVHSLARAMAAIHKGSIAHAEHPEPLLAMVAQEDEALNIVHDMIVNQYGEDNSPREFEVVRHSDGTVEVEIIGDDTADAAMKGLEAVGFSLLEKEGEEEEEPEESGPVWPCYVCGGECTETDVVWVDPESGIEGGEDPFPFHPKCRETYNAPNHAG